MTALKYPVAINALKELAKCTKLEREHSYVPLPIETPFELKELDIQNEKKSFGKKREIESGIASSFNASLCSFLQGIKDGSSKFFVTDSFKMTTRNFEKTLKILEFILTHHGIYITCNYLICHDYVSRRENLLKAAHTSEEFFDKIPYLAEVSEKYKSILKNIA